MLATKFEANQDAACKIRSSSCGGEDRRKEREKKGEKKEKDRERLRGIAIKKTLGRIKGSGKVWKYKE